MGISGAIAAVGAAASAASAAHSIVAGSHSGSSQQQADDAGLKDAEFRQKSADLWDNLQLPTLSNKELQKQTWLQDYSPETYEPWIGQLTQMHDDQTSIDNENAALAQMQQFAKGGLQPSDIAALQQIQQQQAGAGSSAAAQVQAALQARGLGGAGAELAGRLAANQSAATTANSTYNQAMQAAMARQMNAITGSGSMASNIRNQTTDISQKMANIANTFNNQVQTLRTTAAQNAATIHNAAQAYNLQGKQGVANNNVATDNSNTQWQNSVAQQNFNNQQARISGQSNAYNAQATLAGQQQAAYAQRGLGQQQSTTAGLSGLADLAKTIPTIFKGSAPSGEQGTWDPTPTDSSSFDTNFEPSSYDTGGWD